MNENDFEKMLKKKEVGLKVVIYGVSIILGLITIYPFINMLTGSFSSVADVFGLDLKHPFVNIGTGFAKFTKRYHYVFISFKNSFIVATTSTILNVYVSSLTAYAITAYEWKFRAVLSDFIIGVMMIPTTISTIGIMQLVYKLGLTNNLLVFILPSIATPLTVFFMRQYLIASLSREIVQSARLDGAGEFRIFNQIILPLMKPAIATQAIFAYVASWNNLFLPMVVLTEAEKKTIPVMVGSRLDGDVVILFVACAPLIIVYALCSRHIVNGVNLGGVKM